MKSNKGKSAEDIGSMGMMNKTGLQASPKDAKDLVEGLESLPSLEPGDPAAANDIRNDYAMNASPIGTMPLPATLKGMAKTATQALQGRKATVLLDKLGERLAFERTGTRLYEGFLAKLDQRGTFVGGPMRDEVAGFLEEELEHFHLVREAMEKLGADPTAMTPAANVGAVASEGLCKVITDPRTTLAEALHALHIAELTDNDGWSLLISLCGEFGQQDLVERFQTALAEEDEHLAAVRRWMNAWGMAAGTRAAEEEGMPSTL